MKLRFRDNTLRLRVNRREVEILSAGKVLEEHIYFPGDTRIAYVLEASNADLPNASFDSGVIRISAPRDQVRAWADGESIGIYFELPANGALLRVAIEKDLECLDGPAEERDPHAFTRGISKNC